MRKTKPLQRQGGSERREERGEGGRQAGRKVRQWAEWVAVMKEDGRVLHRRRGNGGRGEEGEGGGISDVL